ncbi:hypothetical protein EG329_014346 [Mollisiaceae sp. DMI_Dod_QoI]|nr:hypothetical protein EG329_014346 [Helotiales sp. DMI_Dod_QoI]
MPGTQAGEQNIMMGTGVSFPSFSFQISPLSPLTTFTLFPNLPPQLRYLIWLCAMHPRVVAIKHINTSNPPKPLTRSSIKETYPPLLATNRESRAVTLHLYHSLFPIPSMGPLKWHYRLSSEPDVLHSIATHFIPDTFGSKTPASEIIQKLNKYMSEHPEYAVSARYKNFAKQYRKSKGVIQPAFFSPENDVLYLRRPRPREHGLVGRFQSGLWTPVDPKARRITSLALELDNMNAERAQRLRTRTWTAISPWKNLSGLETLYLVCLNDMEVLRVRLDESGELDEGEWSFRFMS